MICFIGEALIIGSHLTEGFSQTQQRETSFDPDVTLAPDVLTSSVNEQFNHWLHVTLLQFYELLAPRINTTTTRLT